MARRNELDHVSLVRFVEDNIGLVLCGLCEMRELRWGSQVLFVTNPHPGEPWFVAISITLPWCNFCFTLYPGEDVAYGDREVLYNWLKDVFFPEAYKAIFDGNTSDT